MTKPEIISRSKTEVDMTKPIELPPINCRTYIATSPERVYETITSGEGWDAWFTQGTEVDARPGGQITFCWKDWAVNHYTCDAGGAVSGLENSTHPSFTAIIDSSVLEETPVFVKMLRK